MAARAAQHRQRIQAAIDAEVAWLSNTRPEPDWPTFPATEVRRRRGIRLSGGPSAPIEPETRSSPPDEYLDDQSAGLWLRSAAGLAKPTSPVWLRQLVRAYSEWTTGANGAGLAPHDRIEDAPSPWNNAYYHVLALCLPALSDSEIEDLALAPLIALPDESFFDVVTHFLRDVDAVFFNDGGLQGARAVYLRSALVQRLIASGDFRSLVGKRSASIEVHIGPAIAAFFFNDYGFAQPPKAYLFPQAVDRLAPFLPELAKAAVAAPCPFVAVVTLNLLEVSGGRMDDAQRLPAARVGVAPHSPARSAQDAGRIRAQAPARPAIDLRRGGLRPRGAAAARGPALALVVAPAHMAPHDGARRHRAGPRRAADRRGGDQDELRLRDRRIERRQRRLRPPPADLPDP